MAIQINRTLRLPDGEYFHSGGTKSGIAIHHTVGGSARSTFEWWKKDNEMVGTAYIIERDGTIFEVFDPEAWAWQFGLKWDREEKIIFEKRFIGIELASEGGLIEDNGNLYCFDRISQKTLKKRDEALDYGEDYRGYRYFDKYEPAQVDSLIELINDLFDKFEIERRVPENYFEYYGNNLKDFKGIIGHVMVRKDKSDPAPDMSVWERIIDQSEVEKMNILNLNESLQRNLTEQEKDKLFEDNILQINKMNVAAGSMVKGVIMELQRGERDTYIKLRDAEETGHIVYYDFVQGDKGLVFRIARALGFKNVTESKLEVRGA